MEYEDHQLHGALRHHAGDSQGARRQQLRLRAAREFPAPLRPRRRARREPGAVGDGGVQAAAPLAQRRPVQADIRLIHRFQEHCFQSCQRVKAMNKGGLKKYTYIYLEVFKLYNHPSSSFQMSPPPFIKIQNTDVCIEYYNV